MADNVINFMRRLSLNPGVSTSWNPQGLYRDCSTFFYNVLLLLLLSLFSPLCRVFTIIYLKQIMFLGYIVLQLFCIYNLCCM